MRHDGGDVEGDINGDDITLAGVRCFQGGKLAAQHCFRHKVALTSLHALENPLLPGQPQKTQITAAFTQAIAIAFFQRRADQYAGFILLLEAENHVGDALQPGLAIVIISGWLAAILMMFCRG